MMYGHGRRSGRSKVMRLQLLSLKAGTQAGEFTLVATVDGQEQIFPVTVHDGDIRYFSFDDDLKQIIRRNPQETKLLIKLISSFYDGERVELPLSLNKLK